MPYVTTATAEREIRYRFTCEQCGKTTEWYPIRISRKGSAKGSGAAASAAAAQLAENAVRVRFAEIKRDTDAGKYWEQLPNGDLTDKLFSQVTCPACHAIQSWGVRSARNGFGPVFAVTALVTLLYIALIVLFHRVQDALFGAIGIWTYLIIPIVFVAGCIADGGVVRRKVKKQLASQNSGVRRLPEIDWNGMAPEK